MMSECDAWSDESALLYFLPIHSGAKGDAEPAGLMQQRKLV